MDVFILLGTVPGGVAVVESLSEGEVGLCVSRVCVLAGCATRQQALLLS
jgi:predicted Na+-dependent transporter